jgi:uncharacterized repeat protein (TIGR01451 family)
MAADEGGDTVQICHSLGGGRYDATTASESEFIGVQSGHGLHDDDIVPPFTIENPGSEGENSFPGRNWDEPGQDILDNGCKAPKKVRICHATSAEKNPYVSNEPAIANNGDLRGGHLEHTGPVFPAPNWGDIIPPYNYGDGQTFPGYNWSEQGQAIYGNGCDLPPQPPQPKPLRPILHCVEATDGGFLAHFGYDNPNDTTIEPQPSENFFSPGDPNRGQPTSFGPSPNRDKFQVSWDGSALTWHLTGNEVTASSESTPCVGSITVTKQLLPADDPGHFSLKINGNIQGGASEVTNGGTTGTIAVSTGRHTVSESGAAGTSLGSYSVQIVCRANEGNGPAVAQATGPSVAVSVARGDAIVCTITNVRHGTPEPPKPEPPTPPTPPPGPGPLLDLEVVKTAKPAAVRVGELITWTMTVTNRSSVAAADVNGVKVDEPTSVGTELISLVTSQGTCQPGACNLGGLAPGASATVTAVTRALRIGLVVDTVRVGSGETESDYRNNVASALVRVIGPLDPPKFPKICRTLTAAPRRLQAQRTSVVLLTARNRLGHPLVGFPIRARGAGIAALARTNRRGVARMTVAPTRMGLVLFAGGRRRVVHRPTCITLLAALRARSTRVTG